MNPARRHVPPALARPSLAAAAFGVTLLAGEVPATDCDRNGIDDASEVAAGAPDCNGNLLPDPCDLAPEDGFGGARLFVTGSAGSSDLDTIDHDGDGDLDILVAESTADHISVLLGDGARRFDDGYPLPMGSQPRSVEVTDMNGDGRDDIVVGLRSGIRMLRARPAAGFDAEPLASGTADIVDLQAADLDRDGDPDLLLQWGGSFTGRLREIWVNDGSGSVSFHARIGEPPYFQRVQIAGDIDRDGSVDLIGLSDTVAVLWNRGDATFESTSLQGVSSYSPAASSDLDGDGDLEVAFSMTFGGGVSVLWNDGQRQLRRADVSLGGPGGTGTVVAADLDTDGRIDLAATRGRGVIVLRNVGPESFEPATVGSTINGLTDLKVRDLDADGRLDLVFSQASNFLFGVSVASTGVLWNDGSGFAQVEHISLGRVPTNITMGDFDADGELDLATANRASRNITVLLNQRRAVDFSRVSYAVHGTPPAITRSDLDGDGDQDLAVPNSDRDTVTILWNSGRGAFSAGLEIVAGVKPVDVEAADLEGDGDIDLVTANEESLDATVLLAKGGGAFDAASHLPVGGGAVAVAAAHLDGSGSMDLAILDRSTPAIHILVGTGAGAFRIASSWPVEGPADNIQEQADALIAADMDADGSPDLVTGNREVISILWNGGTGTFEDRLRQVAGRGNGKGLEAGDLDADGFPDLAVAAGTNVAGFLVMRSAGSRRFSLAQALGGSEQTSSSAIGDLDADGRQDLALAQWTPRDAVSVLLSTERPPRAVDRDGNGWPDACDNILFLRGDTNGDRTVNLTDMVAILLHLFAGGDAPACADRADVDDGGAIDITDPIFGLSHLFLGGPEPPLPGPAVEGYDRTPDPFPCGDAVECELPSSSTLPGVTLDASGNPCVFTLAQAAAGIDFHYTLSVERALAEVAIPQYPATSCHAPGEHGLSSLEVIGGGEQSYCVCDRGLCAWSELRTSLRPGVYASVLRWTGRNWTGPSDFFNPMGPPFPPGKYTFRVLIRGTYRDDDGVEVGFEVRGGSSFELVP